MSLKAKLTNTPASDKKMTIKRFHRNLIIHAFSKSESQMMAYQTTGR